jgi:hypothetical protein
VWRQAVSRFGISAGFSSKIVTYFVVATGIVALPDITRNQKTRLLIQLILGLNNKDREKNNNRKFTSCLWGNDVVPFRQNGIGDDAQSCLLLLGGFTTSFVNLMSISTVTRRPVVVSVLSINSFTNGTFSKTTPSYARVTCGKTRCSIGFCLEQ